MKHIIDTIDRRQPDDFDNEFAQAVLKGMSANDKSIPSRYFYDEQGSILFEEITKLDEYYPTRTEIKLLKDKVPEMVAASPGGAVLVEFGSGSSIKTEILLDHLTGLKAYVPVDLSPTALNGAELRLREKYPGLRIAPVSADFVEPFALPAWCADAPKIGFFPGSTIGNFHLSDAARLLENFKQDLWPSSRLIIGVDLKKDPAQLEAAYDDRKGVTAKFNLNLLTRINRELGGNFRLPDFRHLAFYNTHEGRVEMHLESRKKQTVDILDRSFCFRAGERIHTENSYKYSVPEFRSIAQRAGWRTLAAWTDEGGLFSVHLLTPKMA